MLLTDPFAQSAFKLPVSPDRLRKAGLERFNLASRGVALFGGLSKKVQNTAYSRYTSVQTKGDSHARCLCLYL
ncbi:hypothetical protein WI69_16440 [Burkholderia diffusa]|nr:hypothetical protein WI28_06615 [Burkholderia diffusa]KVC17044.1 hypothetical protein WI69_16440 [Burkholderia diffusa]